MSLRYAILAVLAEKQRHGYAVHAECEALVGDSLEVDRARVYEMLARLEGRGLLASTAERAGRRRRRVYAIRPDGQRALRAWALAEPTESSALCDLAFRLLVAGCDPEFSRSILWVWEEHERKRLAQRRERRCAAWTHRGFAGFVREVNAGVDIRRGEATIEILASWRESFERYRDGVPPAEILRHLVRRG